ncbi:MAG: 3-isopropylmalate dehydratase small subunit [Spirulina sp.]
MSQIQQIAGSGIPLVGNDIDTDRIIPARFLKCVTFDGLGEQVFADDRSALAGQHPFDQSQYQNASILVVNRNFGCGSSREHAPQAIVRWGIRGIVGESFAEIFLGNCVAIGIPCVTATAEHVTQVQQALAADPSLTIALDLETLRLSYGDQSVPVEMAEGARQAFLAGTWDACGQLVSNADQIAATARRLAYMAW